MITKQEEGKIYLAKLRDDYGPGINDFVIKTLEITMDEKDIYFVRDENGVAAWHCGSLPKTDHRILEITEKTHE
ncbi:MAG: hypothetical protein UT55_C0051G0008 [Candidatus Peregrinibacteria bacterium GW2011_GWE2_39_6]|nr:MAG: hypothetical protein UT36_C0012G0011 [Candidatus Peregrinibacteria bacterium GW2011_GWF2_39_17]KKR24948.1 MAG: hypothetical protein UT55_C0051G0008 [Candidatus Peregrinibacteria bacterium GW2011_GWE2_39_6]